MGKAAVRLHQASDPHDQQRLDSETQKSALTVRRSRQQGRERRKLLLREPFRVLVPGVLMRLLEVTGTLPDGSRNRDLAGFRDEKQLSANVPQTHRIVSVFRQDVGQQLRHELLYRIRVALNQGTHTEDSGMSLANS